MKADHTIRNLRKPGDTNHYLPKGGLFDYVTSANYFGELLEWTGFAILLCNPAAWMFVWWTAANLVPRAHAINKKYRAEFGNDVEVIKKGLAANWDKDITSGEAKEVLDLILSAEI